MKHRFMALAACMLFAGMALPSCSTATAPAPPASSAAAPSATPAGTTAASPAAETLSAGYSEAPTPAPTPSPTAEPSLPAATPEPPEGTLYLATVSLADTKTWLNIRSQPDANAVILGCIPNGGAVTIAVIGEQWHKIVFDGGFAYVSVKHVRIERALAIGETPPAMKLLYAAPKATSGYRTASPSKSPAPTGKKLKDNLVDMRRYSDTIVYYMIFATEDNFMGKPLYPKKLCLLQKGTAQKLKKAQELFEKDGYRIKIYDAYRPISVQKKLFAKVKNSRYIADPNKNGSVHNRGCAIDMTLVDKDGRELEMPSRVHEFSAKAAVNRKDISATVKKNWDYMWSVMKKSGFNYYKSEWWHFEDPACGQYLPTDYDFLKIPMAQ